MHNLFDIYPVAPSLRLLHLYTRLVLQCFTFSLFCILEKKKDLKLLE
jgi:hypothetical protein